jgi:hypothetical protein
MGRDDAECPLHADLHKAGGSSQHAERSSKTPGWNGAQSDHEGEENRAAPADPLRELPEEERARDGGEIVKHGNSVQSLHPEDRLRRQSRNRSEEVRVEVLRAVRKAHHYRHHQQQIKEDSLVLKQRGKYLLEGVRPVAVPCFRLWREERERCQQQCNGRPHEEDRAPAERRRKHLHGYGGQQVAHRVTGLDDAGERAAKPRGRTLQCIGSADSPISSHTYAVKRAADNEDAIVWRKAGEHGTHREVKDAEDQQQPAAVTVCHRTKKKCADRPQSQSKRECVDNGCGRHVEAHGQSVEEEDEDKKIEGIEDPTQDAGDDGESPALRVPFCSGLRGCGHFGRLVSEQVRCACRAPARII